MKTPTRSPPPTSEPPMLRRITTVKMGMPIVTSKTRRMPLRKKTRILTFRATFQDVSVKLPLITDAPPGLRTPTRIIKVTRKLARTSTNTLRRMNMRLILVMSVRRTLPSIPRNTTPITAMQIRFVVLSEVHIHIQIPAISQIARIRKLLNVNVLLLLLHTQLRILSAPVLSTTVTHSDDHSSSRPVNNKKSSDQNSSTTWETKG